MNYKQLGFKAGLEIHQQLETHKLFCDCPSVLTDNKQDITIKRKLRAAKGESEKIDAAAQYEQLKGKTFIYQANKENTCSVEYDEEPPHSINKEALETALQIAILFKATIPDEIQVMRKTVVDGSNTSGFQRTALIARNGIINTSKGIVRISTICLEEDAARKTKEDKKSVTFNLDRLGIPLIEIATEPDIKDPEHAKETAELLGMVLRSTNKVKRGIGTIRQDVNVSIKQGARVEIKGFQDLRKIPRIIENEVKRQQKSKTKEEVRKATPDGKTEFLRPMPGAARMYPETDIKPIIITNQILKKIKLPELISEKIKNYQKLKIPTNIATELVKQNININDYNFKLDKKIIAHILIEIPKELKTRYEIDYNFKKEDFNLILKALEKKEINKDSIKDILLQISKGKKPTFKKIDEKTIDKEIKELIKKNQKLIKEKGERSINILIGELMKKFKGKVDGKLLHKKLKDAISI
jgi:Glu-tRNA(Gln) amidotransferase subunit E-like FAD-binding protein